MTTILLIEDSPEIRENICEILELENYSVLTAENGTKGLALAKETLPDLILCDVLMPEMSGYQVFDGLKEYDSTRNIPFVFVTANVDKREIQAGLDMGIAGYIRKPFDTSELLEIIVAILKKG
jgi:CheY-like chemotaxis protein